MAQEDHKNNLHFHAGQLDRNDRWRLLGRRGCTVWMTGLSASGKSTIASELELALVKRGVPAYRLDGDNIRMGLNANLGFSKEDRAENIRRIGEVCKLFADSGTVTIAAFISPYRQDRDNVRMIHKEAGLPFVECFIDVPLDVAEQRDPKGLYKKARQGLIKGFTGIDDPYETPIAPELHIPTDQLSISQSVDLIIDYLKSSKHLI